MAMRRMAVTAAILAILALPVLAAAAETQHGGMPGMITGEHGKKMEEHGKMGDKAWSGRLGPWSAEARIMDMKAHMQGMKMSAEQMAMMKNTHHVAISLTDPGTKKPVAEGKGTVTVTGPDRKSEKSEFMVMEGHFGADVNLPKPGRYTFAVQIESGGKKGSARFTHTVK